MAIDPPASYCVQKQEPDRPNCGTKPRFWVSFAAVANLVGEALRKVGYRNDQRISARAGAWAASKVALDMDRERSVGSSANLRAAGLSSLV